MYQSCLMSAGVALYVFIREKSVVHKSPQPVRLRAGGYS
jgi:hypothetical protein